METIAIQQFGQVYPADTQTPISLYLDFVGNQPGILLESAEIDKRFGRYSLIAWDFRLLIQCGSQRLTCQSFDSRLDPLNSCSGQPCLAGLKKIIKQIEIIPPEDISPRPALTRSLLGFLGYAFSGLLEPRLNPCFTMDNEHSLLVLAGKQILYDHFYHQCVFLSLDQTKKPSKPSTHQGPSPDLHIGPIQTSPKEDIFLDQVSSVKNLIKEGEAIQVVLSRQQQAAFSGDPFTLYRRLRQANPSPYMFFMNMPGITLLGSSPEVLVRCSNQRLKERPIAGTRPRGKSAEEDEHLAKDLLQDPKECAEHVMLVDLGRNDLGRIATPGSVEVDSFMQIERFSHVMHMTSSISATLRSGLDSIDILQATFPAGTVTGAPKIRAMEIIAATENIDRGPYAGVIGWLGLDSETVDLDTGITIRSLWIKESTLYWQAGAGIVNDSNPLKEWQECQNKAKVVQKIIKHTGGTDVFTHR
jgi:anthranilate synthase component 1